MAQRLRGAPHRFAQYFTDGPDCSEFHSEYPASVHAYLEECKISTTVKSTSLDTLIALPHLVKEQILFELPLLDVDALRLTCKTWWIEIMTNVWLLHSLTEASPTNLRWAASIYVPSHRQRRGTRSGRLDRGSVVSYDKRHVARAFEREVNHQHFCKAVDRQDCWCQRYRKINADFKFDPSRTGKGTVIDAMAFWTSSSIAGIVIVLVKGSFGLGVKGSVSPMTKKVLFYSLDVSGRPALIRAITCPAFVSDIKLESLDRFSTSDSSENHVCLMSHCETWLMHCKLEFRPAFGNIESPIELTITPLFEHAEGLGSAGPTDIASRILSKSPFLRWIEARQLRIGGHGNLWEILSKPDHRWSSREPGRETDHIYHSLPHILVAKHVASEELYIIEVWPQEGRWTRGMEAGGKCVSCGEKDRPMCSREGCQFWLDPFHANPIIHIPRPGRGMVFQNIAVTSVEHGYLNLSLAVIWRDSSDLMSSPVLFIYKFINTKTSRTAIQPDYEAVLPVYLSMQGRRVSSIRRGVGGVHTSSPLLRLLAIPSGKFNDGMNITSTRTRYPSRPRGDDAPLCTDGTIRTRNGCGADQHPVPSLKIVVYGASNDFTYGMVTVFDLNPQIDDIDYPWGSWGRGSPAHWRQVGICACPLHDRSFAVTLPRAMPAVSPKSGWNLLAAIAPFTSWDFVEPSDSRANRGTTELLPSHGRTAALQRLHRRGHAWIRYLIMRTQLSDEDIAVVWFNSKASYWNLLPKPAGWKELRRSGQTRG